MSGFVKCLTQSTQEVNFGSFPFILEVYKIVTKDFSSQDKQLHSELSGSFQDKLFLPYRHYLVSFLSLPVCAVQV